MRKVIISVLLFCLGTVFGLVLSTHLKSSGPHHGLYKDILPELSKDANSPIQYDKETEEYQLKYEAQEDGKKIARSYTLYFSPFTGQKLTSGRSKLFTKPSKGDIQKISAAIQGAKTLGEIETRLGKPDYIYHDISNTDIKTQYTYENLSTSTELIVQQHKDGKLFFLYGGKYIGKTK